MTPDTSLSTPATLAKAALIFSAAPVITIYPLLGQVYGQGQLCATALVSAPIAPPSSMRSAVGRPIPMCRSCSKGTPPPNMAR